MFYGVVKMLLPQICEILFTLSHENIKKRTYDGHTIIISILRMRKMKQC